MKKQNKEYQAEYYKQNKEKRLAQNKLWHDANRPRALSTKKEWYLKNKDRHKAQVENKRLQRTYGITAIQLEAMKALQKNKCATCLHVGKLHVDHNHTTKAVRQLLCHSCNVSLGLLKENLQTLKSMILYIKKHTKETKI